MKYTATTRPLQLAEYTVFPRIIAAPKGGDYSREAIISNIAQ